MHHIIVGRSTIVSGMARPFCKISDESEKNIDVKEIMTARVAIFRSKESFFDVRPIIKNPNINDMKNVTDIQKCRMPVGIGKSPMPIKAKELNTST